MRKHFVTTIAILALAAVPHICVAQDIVPSAPFPDQAVSADSFAVDALANVNDAADFSYTQAKVDKYRELMELNGTARNVRSLLDTVKDATKMVILERMGQQAMTEQQTSAFDQIAVKVLAETEARILNDVAVSQAQTFTLDEIQSLITANSSISAAKYNAGKFAAPDVSQQMVQSYMVDAVVKIVKTYTESVQS